MPTSGGTTNTGQAGYLSPASVEIGATLLSPAAWGTGLNAAVKQIMLAAAFANGAAWVRLRTDKRNIRSAKAILKIPGAREVDSQLESAIVRADGSQRVSRVFRIDPVQ